MREKRRVCAAAAALAALVLSACGGGSAEDKAAETEVTMRLIAFRPASVSVARGDTVTWANQDAAPHTVTSAAFDSGELAKGQTFSRRFPTAGTFPYVCNIHSATMRGEVIVA